MISRVKYAIACMCLAMTATATATAAAKDNQNLVMVSPGGPGSFTFTLLLDLAQPVEKAGFMVIPTYKPGALGIVAANFMRNSSDPYTVLVAGGGITKYESVANKNFKAMIHDYEFVGPMLSTAFILVSADPKIKSLDDILRYPGPVTIGTTSSQTTRFINQFNAIYPGKLFSVPYKDSNQQFINLGGGHVQLMVDRESFFSGKLDNKTNAAIGAAAFTILGTTDETDKRYPTLKSDVIDDAIGVMVKRTAPLEFKAELDKIFREYYSDIKVRAKYKAMGLTLISNTNGSQNLKLKSKITQMELSE